MLAIQTVRFQAIRKCWPRLKHLFTDGAYDCGKLMSEAAYRDFVIEINPEVAEQQGFHLPPRRWLIERTLG